MASAKWVEFYSVWRQLLFAHFFSFHFLSVYHQLLLLLTAHWITFHRHRLSVHSAHLPTVPVVTVFPYATVRYAPSTYPYDNWRTYNVDICAYFWTDAPGRVALNSYSAKSECRKFHTQTEFSFRVLQYGFWDSLSSEKCIGNWWPYTETPHRHE